MASCTSIVSRMVLVLCVAMSLVACATGRSSFNALVVYQEYDGSILPSINTLNDANLVSKALREMKGADVQVHPTVSQAGWEDAFKTYLQKFPEGRREDAVIYVAAHGLRGNDGWTYLVDGQGVPVALEPLLEKVMGVARASMIFIDVCRSPEQMAKQQSALLATQLAEQRAKPESAQAGKLAGLKGNQAVILFSTDAGNWAIDSKGEKGTPFAEAFTREFVKRQELRITLRNIVLDVIRSNEAQGSAKRGQTLVNPVKPDNEQNPWPYGLITHDIFPAGRPSSGGGT